MSAHFDRKWMRVRDRRTILSFIMLLGAMAGLLESAGAIERRTLNNGMLVLENIPKIPKALKGEINPYMNIRRSIFKDWGIDDSTIYVSTRFGQVSQIHRLLSPGSRREQLTFFSEPVGEVKARPKHQQLLFALDSEGSEYSQFYLYDIASGKRLRVTDGQSMNRDALWSEDGSLLVYQSTRRNGHAKDIWMTQFFDDGRFTHRLLLKATDDFFWEPSAISADNQQLLITHYSFSAKSDVYIQRIQSGDLKKVTSPSKTDLSSNQAVSFNQTGDGFFMITDRFSHFKQLTFWDLNTNQETVITKNIANDVEKVVINPVYPTGVFSVNESGYSKLFRFDTGTLQYQGLEGMGVGIVGKLKFSPSGQKLAFSWGMPNAPKDVFVRAFSVDNTALKKPSVPFKEYSLDIQ